MYHRPVHRNRADIGLTVLSLLLEQACQNSQRNIRDDLEQVKLAQLSGLQGEVCQTTRAGPSAIKRLKLPQIDIPPEFL